MMKKTRFNLFSGTAVLIAGICLTSCGSDPLSPGLEYMPDMYRTPALEPYSVNDNFADSMEARVPAKGSIPRGYLPYGIPQTNEGYELAGTSLVNPFPANEAILAEGKEIYTKFCMHCHGKEGAGDGPTVTAGGHPPPPAYNSAALAGLPEGKMFHSITYGKNLMGPHSSQLTVDERWKVVRFVQTLQNPDGDKKTEDDKTDASDETQTAETETNN